MPPGVVPGKMTIKFNSSNVSKLVLVATYEHTFELFKGTLPKNIFILMDDLDKDCRLPSDPENADSLVPIEWKSLGIGPKQFRKLHDEFARAAAWNIADMEKDMAQWLKKGGVIYFHTPAYAVSYDNGGFEYIKIEVYDSSESRNPLLSWVNEIVDLGKTAK